MDPVDDANAIPEFPGFGNHDALELEVADDVADPVDAQSRSEPEQRDFHPPVISAPSGVYNFDNLLACAIRDVSDDAVVLPWDWACIFDPQHDPLDELVPQFEPKLKIPKLIQDLHRKMSV